MCSKDKEPPKKLKDDGQSFQIFDGVTLTDPILTKSPDQDRPLSAPSRLSRVRKLGLGANQPCQTQAGGGSMTITWFNSLYLKDVEDIINFPESLLLITEAGSTVGKYYCSVKKSFLAGEKCLLVHFGSCSTLLDGLECGISVTGFIGEHLQTIQEFTHEWMKLHSKSIERKFMIVREQDRNEYFVKNTVWENGVLREEIVDQKNLGDMQQVITESANILLQRIIVLQKKTGQIELRAINAKGNFQRALYRTLGEGSENIRGEEMKVRGIRRSIFHDNKEVEEWDSIFNDQARMVLRCQLEKDHALIPLWFKPVEKFADSGEFIGTRPPLVWACDMEMYSQYVERNELLVSQNKNYLLRHPMVKALLSDFLQEILIKKPKKIVEFGMQYFDPYLKRLGELNLALSDSDSEAEDNDIDVVDQFATLFRHGSQDAGTMPPDTLDGQSNATDEAWRNWERGMSEEEVLDFPHHGPGPDNNYTGNYDAENYLENPGPDNYEDNTGQDSNYVDSIVQNLDKPPLQNIPFGEDVQDMQALVHMDPQTLDAPLDAPPLNVDSILASTQDILG